MTDAEALAGDIERLGAEGVRAIEAAQSLEDLEHVRVHYVGRNARLPQLLRDVRKFDGDARRLVGTTGNRVRQDLEERLARRERALRAVEEDRQLASDRLDLTLPGRRPPRGAPHPLFDLMHAIEDVFVGLGYEVAEGPEIETDWHNFQALNIPPDHPARTMMDTYYVEGPRGGESALLRTHTSPVQARVMTSKAPPIYVICPGRVFRREDPSAKSYPIFHQVEALAVDEGLTFADLKGTVDAFATGAFGRGTRVRLVPSFFPFTEPSAELRVSCPFCGGDGCARCDRGWMEIGGAGMVDPNVFEAVGIDPERYTGFAFGMGLDRVLLTRYGVTDIRHLFDGDHRFLEQFHGIPVNA